MWTTPYTVIVFFNLDGNVAAAFGEEFWKRRDSVMSVVTHVNLQS